jgi:hypothetical protein
LRRGGIHLLHRFAAVLLRQVGSEFHRAHRHGLVGQFPDQGLVVGFFGQALHAFGVHEHGRRQRGHAAEQAGGRHR